MSNYLPGLRSDITVCKNQKHLVDGWIHKMAIVKYAPRSNDKVFDARIEIC